MAIEDKKKPIDDFDAERVYTEAELEYFHQKIQRFYEEKLNHSTNEKVMILNHEELGVAYGAFTKHMRGGTPYYLANHDRYVQFCNLMRQWDKWRGVKEAKREFAQNKSLEEMVAQNPQEEVPF